jgi:hypothetical protein
MDYGNVVWSVVRAMAGDATALTAGDARDVVWSAISTRRAVEREWPE